MERAPIREPGEQRRYESLPTLALEIYYFFFSSLNGSFLV